MKIDRKFTLVLDAKEFDALTCTLERAIQFGDEKIFPDSAFHGKHKDIVQNILNVIDGGL